MDNTESPEHKYCREAMESSNIEIKLFTALYAHPFYKLTNDWNKDGSRTIKFERWYDHYNYRPEPTSEHFVQWAKQLDEFAKMCRDKVKDLDTITRGSNGN